MTDYIRVLTWNVHGGLGLDGVRDFSRIVDHIAAIDADIVALQEVEGRNRGDRSLPMTIIRDRLGHEGITASTITAADGDYGQILLCRWPLVEAVTYDLSIGRFEPRRAVAATAQTPAGDLRVIATHLGLRFGERSRQVKALCGALADERPTVLMGDFNNWIRYRSAQAVLEHEFADFTRLRTYPARVPLFALDRIFCRPAGVLVSAEVFKSEPLFSDHLPLGATLRLRPADGYQDPDGPRVTVGCIR
jgi:endonuclease/exonuclease/phosphatase family metal-dependent hydrolase